MTRATEAEAAARVDAAADALARGEPHSAVVADAMAAYGVSRRQAQRIVAAGVRAMVADVASDTGDELSLARAGILHQTLATLQRAAVVALEGERPQPAAAVGAARAIIALTELAARMDGERRWADTWKEEMALAPRGIVSTDTVSDGRD